MEVSLRRTISKSQTCLNERDIVAVTYSHSGTDDLPHTHPYRASANMEGEAKAFLTYIVGVALPLHFPRNLVLS